MNKTNDGTFSVMSNENINPLSNPQFTDATLLFQMAPGLYRPYEYGGVKYEIEGYKKSAWIGTTLMISPIYDVVGKDAVEFLNSICVNDFSKLKMKGLRHAVICNDKGQILTDGVVIRIGEDRYRTYWLNPPIDFYIQNTDLDVRGEDKTGTEYFIQIAGERSLEILEDAFDKDLHDIGFAKHRKEMMGDKEVEVVRLGMSGNLAYEIHGPIEEFDEIYGKVWESGKKFEARKLGMHAYNLFNHTEAGFPNIHLHYPLPWMESGEDMKEYMLKNPQISIYNLNRRLTGSAGDNLEKRFVTPYDVGWGFLVNFNHEFRGKEALEKLAAEPKRTLVTLEWNGDDIGKVFATQFKPGEESCESIASDGASDFMGNTFNRYMEYRAESVEADGKKIGISTGRIFSYNYNAMISLAFIDPSYAKEGTELKIVWGTPGTRQMDIRVKVAKTPYNSDVIRNEDKDVNEIPRLKDK